MTEWAWKETNIFFRPNGPHKIDETHNDKGHRFDHVRFGRWGSYEIEFVHPNGFLERGILDMGQAALIRKATIHNCKRIRSRFPPHMMAIIEAAPPEAQAAFWAADENYGARFVCVYGHKDFQGNAIEYFDGNLSAFT